MWRLGAIETFWPRVRAHHAFCEAEILARAAALIFRRPRVAPVLFNPLSSLIALSRVFSCSAALSRSAFNCAIMSMCSSPGEDCRGDQALWSRVYQMWKWTSPLECDAIMDVRPIPGWDDRGAGHEAVEIVAMLKSGDDDPFLPGLMQQHEELSLPFQSPSNQPPMPLPGLRHPILGLRQGFACYGRLLVPCHANCLRMMSRLCPPMYSNWN